MSNLQIFNQTLTNPKTQEYLLQVLGEKKSAFVNNLVSVVANDTKLQECEPLSIMYAAMKATALDLPFDSNLGFAYVIPYKNNRENKVVAQLQLGYKSFIQLAMRSGQFETINVREVRRGEIIDEDFVSGELKFKKLPDEERLDAEIIGYVGFFKLLNGFKKQAYWTIQELQQHGMKYSQSYSSKNEYVQKNSLWATDFDAMAKKTVLKLLLSKYAPLSINMQQAVLTDQAVINQQGSVDSYVDNETLDVTSMQSVEADEQMAEEIAKEQGAEVDNLFDKVMNEKQIKK